MNEPLKPNEYRCALCQGVFDKGWTDEEAQAELQRDFGNVPTESQMTVCDDCYQKACPDANPEVMAAYQAEKN